MEISKGQLSQIDKYIYACGIKFYDVRIEIVDHFANILEQKLVDNPDLNLEQEIIEIHKNFSDSGFSKLLKENTKAVQKQFYKHSLRHLATFFKLPKIIVSGALFYVLYLLMNFVNDKEAFFFTLSVILYLLAFRLLFNVNMRNAKKDTFLSLNMTMNFYNLFYLCVMIFTFIVDFRDIGNFSNNTSNSTELAVFVLLLLFYWSGEYVYRQNKIEVQKQYPNILV